MGKVANVSEVVTPKLPPPPPRNAQNRVGVFRGGRGDRLASWQYDRGRCQRVGQQARMPGLGAEAAAKGVPRGTDRRADTGRDASADAASVWCRSHKLVAGVAVTRPLAAS